MTAHKFIPVAKPLFAGREMEYVTDCMKSSWISSNGKYIGEFEESFAEFCGVRHAIGCCNGTVALHLALLALGVGPGDEVVVPTLTFVATANAVTYCGAKPVFVDSEMETWNIDPALIEKKITPRTRGIIVVHLYGHPAEMDAIKAIARRHKLFILEDAAEAHGAEYKGEKVGSIGDIATFSFYGNKIITTGEGGMVVTNNGALAKKALQLKGQGMDFKKRYWFPMVGYNYRMTNIAAAIGLAQLQKIDFYIRCHLEIAKWYKKYLKDVSGLIFQAERPECKHVYWMFNIVLDESVRIDGQKLLKLLYERGIEARPIFYPMHTLPPYRKACAKQSFKVADLLSKRGISLPTWAGLKENDVAFISETIADLLRNP